MSSALLDDLRARGLIFQIAGEDELPGWLDGGVRTLYCGFDPTADSLHIGSLVPLLMLLFEVATDRVEKGRGVLRVGALGTLVSFLFFSFVAFSSFSVLGRDLPDPPPDTLDLKVAVSLGTDKPSGSLQARRASQGERRLILHRYTLFCERNIP